MALSDYTVCDFHYPPFTRPVYRRGSGPAVIVMHEMPGLHPLVIDFADRLVANGMTAICPSLFGTPGRPVSRRYAATEILKAICIRREFAIWNGDRSSPITDWLRALARQAHAECGGAGVGAVGMCFTGGFALAMMTEPAVVAPVLSQPSLPLPLFAKGQAAAIGATEAEIACVRSRLSEEDLSVIGLRFKSDRLVPDARFARYAAEFGDRFEAIELADADARAGTGIAPHSVLTIHLNDTGATKEAEGRVISFFQQRLGVAQTLPGPASGSHVEGDDFA